MDKTNLHWNLIFHKSLNKVNLLIKKHIVLRKFDKKFIKFTIAKASWLNIFVTSQKLQVHVINVRSEDTFGIV